jgi:quercetin dioxygenase-like cupin family protein
MQVIRTRGVDNNFTGNVCSHELFNISEPCSLRGLLVFFEPKARTHWHRHPGGQILYVVAGKGRVMKRIDDSDEHDERYNIGPGDIIYTAKDEKHWHGAEPDSFMVHLAINLDPPNTTTTWTGEVTNEVYEHGCNSDSQT